MIEPLETHAGQVCGWTLTQDGNPVAYVMERGQPSTAIFVPQPNWWNALRFALSFAENNGCTFIGGPE